MKNRKRERTAITVRGLRLRGYFIGERCVQANQAETAAIMVTNSLQMLMDLLNYSDELTKLGFDLL